ncbi:CopG family transcriptional regulator [Clostridium tertium]|uniref:CopG family transcriptional regulator n=1 Tax=Clostridium tertium TaxID=1559 RepID=UPI000DCF9B72|nr:CopG family transcriptional regulator [Clostridium tertium]
MAIKDDIIRVRVSKEQKVLFKSISKEKKVSMSEFMVVATEDRALKELDKIVSTKDLDIRVTELEKKLQEIKLKMESKRERKSKRVFLKFRFLNK